MDGCKVIVFGRFNFASVVIDARQSLEVADEEKEILDSSSVKANVVEKVKNWSLVER